jgi:XTP/dITP diphosphohydrolase
VIAVDRDPSAPGFRYADRRAIVSTEDESGIERLASAERVEGLIAPEPRGEGGFGYDPIFFYPPFHATLAEAGERKAEVSHRTHAFGQLRTFLLS